MVAEPDEPMPPAVSVACAKTATLPIGGLFQTKVNGLVVAAPMNVLPA